VAGLAPQELRKTAVAIHNLTGGRKVRQAGLEPVEKGFKVFFDRCVGRKVRRAAGVDAARVHDFLKAGASIDPRLIIH
jgi:hypothetical protein